MEPGSEQERKLTTLEMLVLVVTFASFVGTIVNVCFAIIDHNNLKALKAKIV